MSSQTSTIKQPASEQKGSGKARKFLEEDFCNAILENRETKIQASEIPDFVFRNWQVQSLVTDRLDFESLDGLSPSLIKLENSTNAIRAFAKVQLNATFEVCNALAGNVSYSLLKSCALRLAYYENPISRVGWDIDIAVDKHEIAIATEILLSLGYEFAQFDSNTKLFAPADPILRAKVESQHYELGFLARKNRVNGLSEDLKAQIRATANEGGKWHFDQHDNYYCYTTIDVHHGISLEMPVSKLIEDGQSIQFRERSFAVPSSSWLAFHVIYKLYWEGVHAYGKGLYQYADIVRIIPRLDENEQSLLVDRLESANLGVAALYVLRRLPLHFNLKLPETLHCYLEELIPRIDEDPIRSNDLGDMWEKIWGRYKT